MLLSLSFSSEDKDEDEDDDGKPVPLLTALELALLSLSLCGFEGPAATETDEAGASTTGRGSFRSAMGRAAVLVALLLLLTVTGTVAGEREAMEGGARGLLAVDGVGSRDWGVSSFSAADSVMAIPRIGGCAWG